MIINKLGEKFSYGNVEYTIGAPIIGTDQSEYCGLYGCITEIRDGDDKDTENETPDMYCEFDPPTSAKEVEALEEVFSDLYGEKKTIDEICLDSVIMAPDMIKPCAMTDFVFYGYDRN